MSQSEGLWRSPLILGNKVSLYTDHALYLRKLDFDQTVCIKHFHCIDVHGL